MKNISVKTWIITVAITSAITVGCLFIYKIQEANTTEKLYTCLCNSFFVGGFIVLCFGLLTWCANQGAFIGLTYGFKQIFEKRRFKHAFDEREKYGEYREKKLQKKQSFLHLLIVGLVFIVISLVFLTFI